MHRLPPGRWLNAFLRPAAAPTPATWLVADAHHDFRAREPAVSAAAAAGFFTVEAGDPVGAHLMTGTGIRHVPARDGTGHVTGILRLLAHAPRAAAPALAETLTSLDATVPDPGVVVVAADLTAGSALAWEQPLRRLATRHRVLVVQVGDPRQRALPDPGPPRSLTHRGGVSLADRYAAAELRQQSVIAAIHRSGATHLRLRLDTDWITDIGIHLHRQRAALHP